MKLRWLVGALMCAGCTTQDVILAPAEDVTVIVLPPATEDLVDAFDRPRGDDQPPDDKQLAISYPAHETRVPREVPPPTVRWKAEKTFDGYELELHSAQRTVRIYAAEPQAAVPADAYASLLSDEGPTEITVHLRGRSSMEPSRVRAAEPLTLSVVDDALPGEIYFWSTQAQGILRTQLRSTSATKFYPDPAEEPVSEPPDAGSGMDPMMMPMPPMPAPAPNCVGCHTLSRDGTKMAVGYHGEHLRRVSVPSRELPYPEFDDADFGWGTFEPESNHLLYAHKGKLFLADGGSGALVSDSVLPQDVFATHPDWSPDGKHVAVTLLHGMHDKNDAVERSSIARIAVSADGTFGEPEVLVASADDHDTLCFPSYSPDGRFIAYTRATGKSKDQKKSALWLVPSDGGEPVDLVRLNRRVGLSDRAEDMGNHMPTWAPAHDAGRYWLAFSSSRAIGEEKLDDKRDQLWLAALEPEGDAADPSWPALWLPFQRLDDSNHRAFWSPSETVACMMQPELCNAQDDDCDDDVDEDCCSPEPEACDGLDNDCDGERDEGCGCALAEICGDNLDQDCDLRIDEDCVD